MSLTRSELHPELQLAGFSGLPARPSHRRAPSGFIPCRSFFFLVFSSTLLSSCVCVCAVCLSVCICLSVCLHVCICLPVCLPVCVSVYVSLVCRSQHRSSPDLEVPLPLLLFPSRGVSIRAVICNPSRVMVTAAAAPSFLSFLRAWLTASKPQRTLSERRTEAG